MEGSDFDSTYAVFLLENRSGGGGGGGGGGSKDSFKGYHSRGGGGGRGAVKIQGGGECHPPPPLKETPKKKPCMYDVWCQCMYHSNRMGWFKDSFHSLVPKPTPQVTKSCRQEPGNEAIRFTLTVWWQWVGLDRVPCG